MSFLKNLLYQNLTNIKIDIKNKNIGVSFSGGADSTALFFCLLELKKEINFEISVFHLNHLIREESLQEELYIKNLLDNLKINYLILRFDCKKYKINSNESLEMIGRKVRYENIFDFMRIFNIDYLFTAHHLDDQCETVLMRLFKGTGLNGITGIKKIRDDKIIRPFYNIEKKEIYRYLEDNKIFYFEDKTNFDINYERNYIRNVLLKNIGDRFKNYKIHISNFVDIVEEVNQYFIKKLSSKIELIKNRSFIEIDELIRLEKIEFYFLIINIIKNKRDKESVTRSIIDSIEKLLSNYLKNKNIGKKIVYSDKKIIIFYSLGNIYFYERMFYLKLLNSIPNYCKNLNLGENEFFYYYLYYKEEKIDSKEILNLKDSFFIDKEKVNGILVVDLWREGDYIFYDFDKKKKLKKIFNEFKIPWFLRKFVLVIKKLDKNKDIKKNKELNKKENVIKEEIVGFYFNKRYFLSKKFYVDNKTKFVIKIDIKEGINFYG
ncbi:MAG: tRNA lysidine(34) synthetase TilS [Spirochaetes bacterium]|nr:tRNA lysidine(34) synthetase TilS [Spirochaetota bacterium]